MKIRVHKTVMHWNEFRPWAVDIPGDNVSMFFPTWESAMGYVNDWLAFKHR